MNTRDILLVGERSAEWLNTLQPSASSMGIHFISACTFQDGIEIIRQYAEAVDGVVVDVSSATSSEHAESCLSEIGSIAPGLAMLIVAAKNTDSQTSNPGDKKNQFMISVGPEPHEILSQLGRMLGSYEPRQSSSALSRTPEIRISEVAATEASSSNYVGEFAFELVNGFVARNETEVLEAQSVAIRWHHDLLSMLALVDSDVQLRIRFASLSNTARPDNRISIWLTGHVYAPTCALAKQRAENIAVQLGNFLTKGAPCSTPVYGFLSIRDSKQLVECLSPIHSATILEFQDSNTVLNVDSGDGVVELSDELRIACPSRPARLRSLQRLTTVLAQQSSPTIFEVTLKSTKLTANEIDLLRRARNGLWKHGSSLTYSELQVVSNGVDELLRSSSQCFVISCRLGYDGDKAPESLVSTIAGEYCFPLSEVTRLPVTRIPVVGSVGGHEVDRLSVIRSLNSAIDLFRLPMPTQEPICGVPGSHPVFEYTPLMLSANGPLLGGKSVAGGEKEIRVSQEDLRRHVYMLGQTGTGKSTMLQSMILERVKSGMGLCLIDPHGDLLSSVYAHLTKSERSRTIVFDPSDVSGAFGLNMLEYNPSHPEQKTLLVNEMINIFDMLYDLRQTGGPIFEQYMRNAMLLVMDDATQQGTLVDVVKVFQESEYRENLVTGCKNALVKAFWEEASRTRGDVGLENISPYITSKLNQFVSNDYIFPIISQCKSALNFRELIDSNKILLVKLSKGRLGDIGVRLLGMVLFARLLLAALSRDDKLEDERIDFCLFVDEFQNFTSESVAQMLSEARKYRLNLVLANQTLGQLRSTILESVLGNTGNLLFFRPGINDFERIKPYIDPPFQREEVLNLPNHFAIGKFLLQGVPLSPFVFKTISPSTI